MDRVTLMEKGLEFMTNFAAPSILTGRFVASVVNSSREAIEEAFTNPGNILVQNVEQLYADKVYSGYTSIGEIDEQPGAIIVKLEKGGA